MDSKIINKEIKKHIFPILKELGFDFFASRTACRHKDNKIDVIEFRSFTSFYAQLLKCTTFSFSISLGEFFKCIPVANNNLPDKYKIKERLGEICPGTPDCHIRREMNKTIKQNECLRSDIWFVDQGGLNLENVISDAIQVVRSDAIQWFDRFDNDEEVLRTLLNDEEDMQGTWGFGRNPSPIRYYYSGYMALALRDFNLAATSLEKIVDFESFKSEQLSRDFNYALDKSTLDKENRQA